MRSSARKFLLALGVVTLACSSGEITGPGTDNTASTSPTNAPATIAITPPTNSSLVVGTSISLAVAIKNATGQDISGLSITWSSSDATVATVSATGTLTAHKPGPVTITASAAGRSSSVNVTVVDVQVKTVLVQMRTPLLPGETATAAAFPKDSTDVPLAGRTVTWSSSNPSVADVTPSGVVTAVSQGTASIIGTVDGVNGMVSLLVLPAPISSIAVALASPSLTQVGATTTATATPTDAFGNPLAGRFILWTSSNPAVAKVNQSGVVTAVAAGSATISANGENQTGSAAVTVTISSTPTPPPTPTQAPVASVALAGLSGQLHPSQSAQITPTLRDAQGNQLNGRVIVWASSNPNAATVSQSGLVTCFSSGTTTITAISEGVTGSLQVTVSQVVTGGGVASVSLTTTNAVFQPTQTLQVTAQLRDAQNQIVTGNITYASSNSAVATVSASGIVTAISSGTSVITGTSSGVLGTLTVTVPKVQVVTVTAPSTTLQPTQTTHASVTLVGSDGNPALNRVFAWSSSAPTVATVDNTGNVTAVAAGSAQITVTSEGVTGFVTVTVPGGASSINVTAPNVTLQPTQTSQATAVLLGPGGSPVSNAPMQWSTLNPAVATVSQSGVITATGPGTAQIQATSGTTVGSLTITVPPVATITVTAPNSTRQPTQTMQASVTLRDASSQACTNRAIVWSSSNPAVATVSASGLVTGVASGSTQIIVTSEGQTGSVTVTVPPVATVNLTIAGGITVGQSQQITASLLDANGQAATNRVTTWQSATPANVTVSASGVVTGIAAGTSVITATSEGKSGTVTVSVAPTGSPAGSIQLIAGAPSLLLGQTTQLSAIVLDAAGNPTNVTPVWSSSNTAKATVSSSGLVTAVNNSTLGNVTITATAGTKSATTTIAVIGHGTETLAALPNIFLDTTEPVAPAAGRTVITVAAGGNFQAALNAAQPGDVIELAAGATYSGNFTLPNKGTSTSWIVIRPSNYQQLPAAGQRMTPTIAAQLDLPTIQSPNSAPAIQPNTAAHHYRFTGIEVTMATAGNSVNYGLISTDANSGQNQMSQVPHDLVFDRMYIHGAPTFTLRRCVALNSAYTSIIDSDLRECHDPGQDSQAIAGWNGPGPFKIVNNYLEGATENVIFGGADPAIPNMTPSDIEIRGNHIYKPIAFKNVWAVKNLLELKHAQRVLIEGNILDGSWIQGQVGYGVVLKTVNQNGACTWCVTQDVTFRYNLVRNVGGGFNIAASPDNGFADTHARRITVTDNVVSTINVAPYTGTGIGFMISDDLQDVTMAHNTLMSPTNSALQLGLGGTGYTARTVFRDNVAHGGLYSVIGDNVGTGTNAITRYMPGGVFAANVLIQTFGSAGFPAGSFYPTSPNTIGFANAGGGDFSLLSSSPYRAAGTDGRDPGVDMPGLLQRIANVIVP